MAFVFVPPPQPSEQAHEMSRRVQAALAGYLAEHPGVTNLEIRQAFELAFRALRRGSDARAAIAVMAGVLVAALLALLVGVQAADPNATVYVAMALAGIAIVVAFVVVARKLR